MSAPLEPIVCIASEHESLWWDDSNFDFKYIDGRRWKLKSAFPFRYEFKGTLVDGAVPEGFMIDFHSVPRILWPIIHPFEFGQAAALHDYGYRKQIKRALVDEIYLAALTKCGASEGRRKVMYRAVRMFGWLPYRRARNNVE